MLSLTAPASIMGPRFDLDGQPIQALRICMIGAGGFIGSHLCETLMWETEHSVDAIDLWSDKIDHLLDESHPWKGRIAFHKFDIRNDPRLEVLVKACDLVSC